MRVGLLGAGRIGAFHAATLQDHPEVDELVIADADPAAASALAAAVSATPVATTAEALGADLDAVVIAAATSAHAALIHAAVDAGVPAFCEKPVALDLEETAAVVDQVAATGVALQVGFQRRFDLGYRDARATIASGRLGRVHTVRMVAADPAAPPRAYLAGSGGMFRDMHIHDFDLARWLTGTEVAEVFAFGGVLGGDAFPSCGDIDTAALALSLVDGTLVTITGTRHHAAGYDVRTEISGSLGSVAVGFDDRTPIASCPEARRQPAARPYESFLDRFATAYRAELHGFVDLVQGRGVNACTADDALQALRVAVAAERSLEQGRPVGLAEVV